jgi:HSP20 family protein
VVGAGQDRNREKITRHFECSMKKLVKWDPLKTLSVWEPFSTWGPFRELEEMQNRLTSFFGRHLPLLHEFSQAEELMPAAWVPRVDVVEHDKEYQIDVELPGMKKDEIKVSVEDRVLSISGERKSEKEEKGKKYHRTERSYGAFMRSFTLPEDASGEKLHADFQEGILKVHIPKVEGAKTKAIEVQVS